MAGDVSKRKEAPTVILTKLQMKAVVSGIMKRVEKTDFFQKRADVFFSNASQDQEDAKTRWRSKIPTFCGRNDHDGYWEWEHKMELVFDGQNYSESKMVRWATSKFCGDAIQWWDQLVATRRWTGERQVTSWFELKHVMKKHFVYGSYSKKQTKPWCHDCDQPRKSQSHKQRRNPRPPSRAKEPLYSKKEPAIQELKTKPSKVIKETETENEFSLFPSQSELLISSACDELTNFEPVQPSSIVPVSQVSEEHSPETEQKSVAQVEVMEQLSSLELRTIPKSLFPNQQEHCKELSVINSVPYMFVRISSDDVKRFGLGNMKEFCVPSSIFDKMIHSFKKLELDKLSDQKHFQSVSELNPGLVLSLNQFMKHNKSLDHPKKRIELVLQQTDFFFRKPYDSFPCFDDNGFDLSFSRHELITGDLFSAPCTWKEYMVRNLQKPKSLGAETDFFCDSVLKPVHSYFESDLDFLCSESDQVRHDLEMFNKVSGLDTILICNAYFDVHFERLKRVLHVLGKETLFSDLNKYMSCTYDPGILMFTLSVQEKQFQSQRNKSIDHTYQPKIWRWKYLRKMAYKLQGSLCPLLHFDVIFMLIFLVIFLASYLFPYCADGSDLRTNPFKGGGHDATRLEPAATLEQKELNQLKDTDGELNQLKDTDGELNQLKDTDDELNQLTHSEDELNQLTHSEDELNQLTHSQVELNTDGKKGGAETQGKHSNQVQDPFCLSKGPITRSQTKRLKDAMSVLVKSIPEPKSIEETNQNRCILFNHCEIHPL